MNAHADIKLNADQRGRLRKALTASPNWRDYRRANSVSTDSMTAEQLLKAANCLKIDLAALFEKAEQMNIHHKPRPHDAAKVTALAERIEPHLDAMSANDATFAADVLKTIHEKQEGAATDSQYYSLARIADRYDPPAKEEKAKKAPKEEYGEKAEEPKASASVSVSAPQVFTAQGDAGAQLAALITQLAGQSVNPEQVAAIVDERIKAALETIPTVRIECKGFDGQAREINGHQHPQFKKLLRAAGSRMANGYPPSIWLAGPAGSGKTHAGHQLADALDLPFHLNGALSMPHELLGFIDAGGTYHRTPFREAYEHGGVYMFDEVDGSDNSALLALNAALANGHATFPDMRIKRHENCIILASANTWGLGATAEYVGRAKIDAAFLSRFPVRIAWDYDTDLEIAISGNEKFARRVIKAREKARAAGIKVLIDPRASQAGAALIAAGMSEQDAADMTYLANVSADQRRIVEA